MFTIPNNESRGEKSGKRCKMCWILLFWKIYYYFYYKHLNYLCNIPDNDLSFPSGGNQSVGGSEHGGSKSGAVHVPTGRKQSGCAHGKIRQWYQLTLMV